MGIVGGHIGYSLLQMLAPPEKMRQREDPGISSNPEFEMFFGQDFPKLISGKTVVDYGCGWGHDAVAMAKLGARVIGIDVQERFVEAGRALARENNVEDRCFFTTHTDHKADIVISKAAFEHYSQPAEVLDDIARLLTPNGQALVSFGETWFHPYGGHTFSIFPWAHLIFTEEALIKWRSQFKTDGASKFCEVEGGLNKMTIRQFQRLVMQSPLVFATFETLPIRGMPILKHRLLVEFGTWLVRARLKLK